MDLYTEVKRLLNDNTPPLKTQERDSHIEEIMQRMNDQKKISESKSNSSSSVGINQTTIEEEI